MKIIKLVFFLILLSAGGAAWYFLQPEPVIAPELSRYSTQWPLPHHDYDNSRSNPDSAINTASIGKLQPLWAFALPAAASASGFEGSLVIQGEKVYCQDGLSNVYAVDLNSGKLLWKRDYQLAATGLGGLAVARKRVYVSKGGTQIAALDLKGRELWTSQLTDKANTAISSQPVEYDGLVYVATSAVRLEDDSLTDAWGRVYALDCKNGEVKWSFNTAQDSMLKSTAPWSSGGVCFSPAIDTQNGRVFWTTVLTGPWPSNTDQTGSSVQAGTRVFSQQLFSFEHLGGQVLWSNRLRDGDYLNLGLQAPPVIASLNNRRLILASGKGGLIYAVESDGGRPLWEMAVGEHQNNQLQEPPRNATQVLPGPQGGVASPMAYMEGILYVPVVNQAGIYSPGKPEPVAPDLERSGGELLAVDVHYGKVLWRQAFDSAVLGGATVLGDLVFTSTYGGWIYAFNRINGEKLWEYQTNGNIKGWPAAAGKTIVFPLELNSTGPLLAAFSLPGV